MAGESAQSVGVEVPKTLRPWEAEIPKSPWLETEKRRQQIGDAFELGLTVGSAYNFAKGSITAKFSRFRSGFNYARANCFRTTGAITVVFMIAGSIDNALVYYRQKDDPLNTFASNALAAAAVTARRGPIISSCSGVALGTLGALMQYYSPILDAEITEAEIRKSNKAKP